MGRWTSKELAKDEVGQLHVVSVSYLDGHFQVDGEKWCYYHGTKEECEKALMLMLAGKDGQARAGGSPTKEEK